MDTENGVLELWSNGGTRNGVKEYRSSGVAGPLCGAGPEAGAPRKDREAGGDGKDGLGECGMWGKGGWRWENGPALPTFSHVIRRKSLISRI